MGSKHRRKNTPASPTSVSSAGNFQNSALPQSTGMVRSYPTLIPWNSKIQETSWQSRDRVRISRFLQDTMPVVAYCCQALPKEAIGGGIGLKSVSANPDFREASTKLFRQWADSEAVDTRKESSFYALQSRLLSTIFGDGEVFVQKVAARQLDADGNDATLAWSLNDKTRRRLQLQVYTRDQVGSNGTPVKNDERWNDGVLYNALDQIQKVRVLQTTSSILQTDAEAFTDIPAANIKHLKRSIRFNQYHGTPIFFSGESDLLDALDMKAIRKHAAKIKSAIMGATVTQSGQIPMAMQSMMAKGVAGNPATDNGRRYAEIFGGAVMIPLAQNEDVKWFQAQEAMPYSEFIEELISPVVYTFDIPPEWIFSLGKLSGSAQRAVLAKVRKAYARMRELLQPFLQWCWEWVIGDAMLNGPLKQFSNVEDWNHIDLVSDPDPSVDLFRDYKSDKDKILGNIGTVEDYIEATTGGSGVAVRHAAIDEKLDNIRYALSRATGKPIDQVTVPASLAVICAIDPTLLQAAQGIVATLSPDQIAADLAAITDENKTE